MTLVYLISHQKNYFISPPIQKVSVANGSLQVQINHIPPQVSTNAQVASTADSNAAWQEDKVVKSVVIADDPFDSPY